MMINISFFYITIVYKSLLIVLGTLHRNQLPGRFTWLWKVPKCGQQVAHISWIKLRFTHTYHSHYFYDISVKYLNKISLPRRGMSSIPDERGPAGQPPLACICSQNDLLLFVSAQGQKSTCDRMSKLIFQLVEGVQR